MITKTYQTQTLSEAIAAIKKDLGPKANIVSTRRILPERRWFSKKPGGVEVIATVEERFLTLEQKEGLEHPKKTMPNGSDLDSESAVSIKFSKESREKVLQNELIQLKSERDALNRQLKAAQGASGVCVLADTRVPLKDLFDSQGVSARLFDGWKQRYLDLPQNAPYDDVCDACAAYLATFCPAYQAALPACLAIVGPSGSGKTLTLSKLENLLKMQGKTVTVVSVPKTWFDQGGDFLADVGPADHVLIDIPALSARNMSHVALLGSFLVSKQIPVMATFSASDSQIKPQLSCYQGLGIVGVILTKVDELLTVGSLLDYLSLAEVPVAFFGIGNTGQDDIETATPERLLSLFFGVA